MHFSLLPDDPEGRREAEGYLHGLTLLMMWGSVFSALLVGFLYYVLPFAQGEIILMLLAIVTFDLIVFTVAYYNGKNEFRYFSASTQAVIVLLTVTFAITINLNFFGSTSLSMAAVYVIAVAVGTLYMRPRAGAVATGIVLSFYGGLLIAEGNGWIQYAPHAFEAYDFDNFRTHAIRCFLELAFECIMAFAVTFYIWRELQQRRVEAVEAKNTIEQAHEKLVVLDEAKSRFLSIVSHDLRTPITSIKAFGEIVEEEVDGENKKFMQTIVSEADRLNRLVTALLDLDKMEAGKMEWNLTPSDIRPVLVNAAEVFRAAAHDKNVSLVEDIAEDLPTINAENDRLSQLVANLLSNAIKFTPEEGTVTLSATPNGTAVEISVRDTGPGIEQEDIDRIFDRFSQTKTGKQQGGGTGLGLAIAKEIATGHGGTLSATSVIGEGTTFIVTLPV